jgi:hypothetical protein
MLPLAGADAQSAQNDAGRVRDRDDRRGGAALSSMTPLARAHSRVTSLGDNDSCCTLVRVPSSSADYRGGLRPFIFAQRFTRATPAMTMMTIHA